MSTFLSLRGEKVDPVFLLEGGQPCDKGLLDSFLRRSVLAAGLDVNHYKGHSFRIRAATSAAAAGHSDADIQRLGRWKSRAFQRSVRIPKLNVWCSSVFADSKLCLGLQRLRCVSYVKKYGPGMVQN